jgi:hypothetical protein
MGFAGALGGRVGDGPSISSLSHTSQRCQIVRPRKSVRKVGGRSNGIKILAKAAAAAVNTPAKVAMIGQPSNAKGPLGKLTPEECSDIYRDMKLGREFEEM